MTATIDGYPTIFRTFEVIVVAEGEDEELVTTEYIFNSKSWGTSQSDWESNKDGNGYMANQGVQITSGASGANATTKITFYNIKSIEILYATNTSNGAGKIETKIGDTIVQDFSVTTSGGTTPRSGGIINVDSLDGSITISVTCTTNSIYIYGINIVHFPN